MNPIALKTAIDDIADSRGLTHEAVAMALKDAMQRAYIGYLKGGEDAMVEVTFDETNGFLALAQLKTVVKEVQDDYLEISPEDAKADAAETIDHLEEVLKDAKDPFAQNDIKTLLAKVKEAEGNIKLGYQYPLYCPIDEVTKVTANAVKNNLRLKIGEAERQALYEIYKDHIGEMVTGTVEKADDRSVSVNIGRTTVELTRREMIGDEYFKVGDTIKVYIQEVKEAAVEGKPSHGPQIEATRSSEGFLKRLFEEEIHEIYDGTVIIKGIAREAGVRSKVAVMSNNEDVDATGACIGPGGSRIQKIVGQLGNGKDKEKIDIIAYSDDPALYIAESLRPASVLGVALLDPHALPHPTARAVVKDEQLSLAIGKKGANARLADKLTGWSIDIIEESEAQKTQLSYVRLEDLKKQVEETKKAKERAAYAAKSVQEFERQQTLSQDVGPASESTPAPVVAAPVSGAAPVLAAASTPEGLAATPIAPAASAPAAPSVAAPIPEKKPAPVITPTVVKTTTTLDALEKELAESAKFQKTAPVYEKERGGKFLKSRRPHQISEKEVAHPAPSSEPVPGGSLPIYTQEELNEMAKEEDSPTSPEATPEEADLDQYDKYYDEDKK